MEDGIVLYSILVCGLCRVRTRIRRTLNEMFVWEHEELDGNTYLYKYRTGLIMYTEIFYFESKFAYSWRWVAEVFRSNHYDCQDW